jgi:hypothetical protein
LASCWPTSIGFKDKSMPPEWEKFYLITLENNAPNTPLSYSATLSENIKDGVQNNTSLLLSNVQDSAQLVIDGQISNYSITPVALQEGDFATKNRLTVSVSFQIEILAPNEETKTMSSTRFVDYDADTDHWVVESELLQEVNDLIVQDVINKLLSNW